MRRSGCSISTRFPEGVRYAYLDYLGRYPVLMGVRGKGSGFPCRSCGFWTLSDPVNGSYEICPVCFWEDDPVQNEDPEYQGGANSVSLTTARRNYVAHGACDQEFVGNVRAPKVEEIPSFRSWTQDPEKQAALERGIRSALLETARAMLSGKLGVIDGCSAIACLASGMEDDRLRPTLQTFEIVAGETEELPRGDVGDLWHPAALAAKDVEVAAYEAQVTNEVFNACRSLEALLVLDPPPRTKPNSQPELSG